MKDIRLYIGGKLVDLEESTSLPFNYQLEDFSNPTTVKINHSSTITLKGTKTNNKLFGEFYKVDRMQHHSSFNPSKRVDYQLFCDSDLVESGYIQLNDVSVLNGDINYNITLYGGLGDFFYGLKYKEDGTDKTLADLRYFVRDDNGNLLASDDELTFRINKELIDRSFSKDWNTVGDTLTDYIAFIPAYNGSYDNFDSSKCLVNTNGLRTSLPASIIDNDNTYTPYNGYGLMNLESEYNEWEMRELRSYYQRPAIKLSKLIETICREENSGYKVEYDKSFFNDDNPYWSKTFVALPLLTSNDYDTESETSSDIQIDGDTTISESRTNFTNTITVNGMKYESTDGVLDLSGADTGSALNMNLDVQLKADVISPYNELYLWNQPSGYETANFCIALWATVEDADTGEVLGRSQAYQFQSGKITSPTGSVYITPQDISTGIVMGHFYDGLFKSDVGESSFTIIMSDSNVADRVRIVLHTLMGPSKSSYTLSTKFTDYHTYPFTAHFDITGAVMIDLNVGVSSNRQITKKMLLSTESSPCDFLLDYTKRFGLYFIKDISEKKITICSRNTFFTGDVENIDDRIDWSKDFTITPILFDNKYYKLALDTPDTKWAKRYRSTYEQIYGQKRISTGYNFNSETKELYEDNIYQGILPILDSDKYYRVYADRFNNIIPPFFCDNCTYELFNGDESATRDIYAVNTVGSSIDLNSVPGGDCWAKSCFFSTDNDSKSLEEISSCILFWNGVKDCKDILNRPVTYTITDDVREMNKLNDKQACWLYTDSLTDAAGNQIAIKRTSLPQYLPYIEHSNIVDYSLDFGMPKEVYIDTLAYDESTTVYDRFWKAFYNDQFHIDTKKVTCWVKFDRVQQEDLRKFYWWNNAIWLLNKVNDFDITNNGTVQCEFIRVQDTANYTDGQKI